MRKYNVAVYGTGSMGMGIISLILEKESLNLVGVVSKRKEREGMDVGDILDGRKTGIKITNSVEKLFEKKLIFFFTCHGVKSCGCLSRNCPNFEK